MADGRGPLGGEGEEQGKLPCPLGRGEPAELPGQSPALQSPLQVTWVLGGIGRRLRGEQERQEGGAIQEE